MKRTFLFLLTNLGIILVLSVTAQVLGLNRYLDANGLNLGSLLGFAALMGMGGAFISLAISKWSALRMVGGQVITSPQNNTEAWLFATVQMYAKEAGIGMPQVAIYDSPEINAFATGMNRNNALVAVSTGLLQQLRREEAEAVIGHEIAHVANGDMVTLALIQGVVNTFVIFLARVIGYAVDKFILKNENAQGMAYFVTYFIAEMVLGVLASTIVMWFSRQREFRADAGGAQLAGRQNMIAALEALQRAHEPSALPEKMAAFGIAGGNKVSGLRRLFMTHPPLEERIHALRQGQ